MEQRAPRLASAAKILGSLIIIAAAANLKLDLLEYSGVSIEEYVAISLSVLLFIIAYFASREREIVGLTDNLTLEEQFAQLESTPTRSSGLTITNDNQSSHTKGIIDSILGAKAEVNEQQVSQAIGTLSTGDFGQLAQSMAEQLPAPHKHAERVVESPRISSPETDVSARANVPLPEITAEINSLADELPDLPELDFADVTASEEITTESQAMPDLSDLFADEVVEQNDDNHSIVEFETPDLPDIDDLF